MSDTTPRTQTLPAGQNPAAGAWRENQQRKEAERDALLKLEEAAKRVSLAHKILDALVKGSDFADIPFVQLLAEHFPEFDTGDRMKDASTVMESTVADLRTALADLARVREGK